MLWLNLQPDPFQSRPPPLKPVYLLVNPMNYHRSLLTLFKTVNGFPASLCTLTWSMWRLSLPWIWLLIHMDISVCSMVSQTTIKLMHICVKSVFSTASIISNNVIIIPYLMPQHLFFKMRIGPNKCEEKIKSKKMRTSTRPGVHCPKLTVWAVSTNPSLFCRTNLVL